MEVRWTLSALGDLQSAGDFIRRQNARAAASTAERTLEAVETLVMHPNLGRPGRVQGTRELVVSGSPFLVVYRVRLDEIQILRVLHHSRKWPK